MEHIIDIPPEMTHDVGKGVIAMYNKSIIPDVENQLAEMMTDSNTTTTTVIVTIPQKITTFLFNVFKAFSPFST
jgi:hypothetical protein